MIPMLKDHKPFITLGEVKTDFLQAIQDLKEIITVIRNWL